MFQFFILNVEHFIRCSSVGMGLNESWFLVCSRDLLSANMWSTLNALCGEKVLCMLLGLREQEKKEGAASLWNMLDHDDDDDVGISCFSSYFTWKAAFFDK